LLNDTVGSSNTAGGASALASNTGGQQNTAIGREALLGNSTGNFNTAEGVSALAGNTTGQKNTAVGLKALFGNSTGQSNTAIGFGAGINLTTGSNNIEIGTGGAAADDKLIRIGTQGTQTGTFISGIAGTAVTGADVVINGQGKLGVVASSARFKKDIANMGDSTDALMKLRPVTFKYRNDDRGVTQYGLVAEEVEKVYPELVTYDADGRIESVRYSMLTSMLLNQLQKENRENRHLSEQLGSTQRDIAELKAEHENEVLVRARLEKRLAAMEQVIARSRATVAPSAFYSRPRPSASSEVVN